MTKIFSKESRKQLIVLLVSLALIDFVLNTIIIGKQGFYQSFLSIFVGVPILAFAAGSLIGLIPVKQRKYLDRFLTVSLALILIIECFLCISYLYLIIRFAIGEFC